MQDTVPPRCPPTGQLLISSPLIYHFEVYHMFNMFRCHTHAIFPISDINSPVVNGGSGSER